MAIDTPKVVSINNNPATVIQPHTFKSGRKGWYSRQNTMIDGKQVVIQVMVYPK